MTVKEQAAKIKLLLPALVIAMKRPDTPPLAKIMATITVVYALSPLDLIPDFIPIIGYLDDLLILPLLGLATIKLIPPDIFSQCQEQAALKAQQRVKKWYYAIPIILIWVVVLAVIIRAIFS